MESYSTIIFDEYTHSKVGLLDENSPVKEGMVTFDRETDDASIGVSIVFKSQKQVNDLIGQLIKLKKQMKNEKKLTPFEKMVKSIKDKSFDPKITDDFVNSNPTGEQSKEILDLLGEALVDSLSNVMKKL